MTTDSILFSGSGIDAEDESLTGASLVWTSDLNGQIGTGETFSAFLSAGSHVITLTVTDSEGATGADSANTTVAAPGSTETVLYLSLGSSGTVDGLNVANEDILEFNGTDFSLFFDGSDVGVGGFRLNAFAVISATEIIMPFDQAGSVPGISGTVDDSDIVKFTATSLGPTTSGQFELYFDGSDVGLTRSGEDVDALKLLSNGHLLVSTRGSVRVQGVSGADEDVLEFTPSSLGANTAGSWSLYFNGSDVGLTSSEEDVDGLGLDAEGKLYLSTTGGFSSNGVSGADEDVFIFIPSSLGSNTSGTFDPTLLFDGSTYGLISNDIYGIDIPDGPSNEPPVPPTGLTADDRASDEGGAIDLSWTPSGSGDVTEQRLYRGTSSGSHPTLVATFADNTTSVYTDEGLNNGQTYYYVVRAFNGTTESSDSNEASAVPVDNLAPVPPTGLTADDRASDEGGAIELGWTPSGSGDVTEQRLY